MKHEVRRTKTCLLPTSAQEGVFTGLVVSEAVLPQMVREAVSEK